MKISIITLFPEVFEPILNSSILKRAQKKGLVEFKLVDLRDFGEGKHQVIDDRPYGGGAGMVLKADILAKALKSVYRLPSTAKVGSRKSEVGRQIIITSASGKPYKQETARRLSKKNHLIIVCGHYEGVDQRFADKYVDEEISIGDYVLTGGEIPAMAIIDSITRLIPGVLEKPEATTDESFSTFHHPPSRFAKAPASLDARRARRATFQLLEYPQYTRPAEFEGKKVPEILLSGNHAEIAKWRSQKSLEKTKKIRPDLLKNKTVST